MNTVLHVGIRFAHPDRLSSLPLDLGLKDPRVLRGVYDALRTSPGIIGVDLVSQGNVYSGGRPYYVVTTSTTAPLADGIAESLRLSAASLHEGSVQFSLAWSQDGGIKVALVDVTLEVL